MAKRYYNLEKETKEYLKLCDSFGLSPILNIDNINNFCIKQKSLNRNSGFLDPRFLSLFCWYDATDLSTVLSSISPNSPATLGQSVTRWLDKSGNNRHVEQLTETQKPIFGSGSINNFPCLRFDGVNDTLLSTASVTIGAPVLYFSILKRIDSINGLRNIISIGGSSAFGYATNTTRSLELWQGTVSFFSSNTNAPVSGTPFIATGFANSRFSQIQANSNIEYGFTGTSSYTGVIEIASRASSRYLNADIIETGIISLLNVTTKNYNNLINYFNCKYNLF